jgi:hypothetical protein
VSLLSPLLSTPPPFVSFCWDGDWPCGSGWPAIYHINQAVLLLSDRPVLVNLAGVSHHTWLKKKKKKCAIPSIKLLHTSGNQMWLIMCFIHRWGFSRLQVTLKWKVGYFFVVLFRCPKFRSVNTFSLFPVTLCLWVKQHLICSTGIKVKMTKLSLRLCMITSWPSSSGTLRVVKYPVLMSEGWGQIKNKDWGFLWDYGFWFLVWFWACL